jgi:AraC-like DNA-binding protein
MFSHQFQIDGRNYRPRTDVLSISHQHHQLNLLIANAISLVESDEKSALAFVKQASAIAVCLELLDGNAAQPSRGLAPWQARRVKQHIESQYGRRILIDELAKLVRLSTSYFAVAFRASFGTSPHDYVCRRRIHHAQLQMATTDRPLCEIALNCGFADQSHLSRVFRRVTGQTPAAWRRTKRVHETDPVGLHVELLG